MMQLPKVPSTMQALASKAGSPAGNNLTTPTNQVRKNRIRTGGFPQVQAPPQQQAPMQAPIIMPVEPPPPPSFSAPPMSAQDMGRVIEEAGFPPDLHRDNTDLLVELYERGAFLW